MEQLPQSIESERYILGCILSYKDDMNNCIEFGLEPIFFYDNKNRLIYDACKKCESVDMVAVSHELKRTNNLTYIGGIVELSRIISSCGTNGHLELHINIIKNDYLRRKLIETSKETENEAYKDNDINDVISSTNKAIDEINDINGGTTKVKSLPILLEDSLIRAENRAKYYKENGTIQGIKTNLKPLDNVIYGLQPNKLIILAARPAMGKTAFALFIAKQVSKTNDVLFFSLEMGEDELSDRLILGNTDINPDKYAKGDLNTDDWSALHQSNDKLYVHKIHIEDNPAMTIDKIKAKATNYKHKNKCDVIIIDYLQLIDMRTHNKNYNKTNEVGELSRKAKLLAKQLKVPVILLSQLNRDVEKRPDKRPYLSDLRDSGNIEQDADIIMFCLRPAYYDITKDSDGVDLPENFFELIIAKNRGGITGSVKLLHTVGLTNFHAYEQNRVFEDYKENYVSNNVVTCDPLDEPF